jgi:hypothetical protein
MGLADRRIVAFLGMHPASAFRVGRALHARSADAACWNTCCGGLHIERQGTLSELSYDRLGGRECQVGSGSFLGRVATADGSRAFQPKRRRPRAYVKSRSDGLNRRFATDGRLSTSEPRSGQQARSHAERGNEKRQQPSAPAPLPKGEGSFVTSSPTPLQSP